VVKSQLSDKHKQAPAALAVGDLHIASFGTSGDGFGRPISGIDDFDEAYPLPYANDLVRLAVSAVLDASEGEIRARCGAMAGAGAFIISTTASSLIPVAADPLSRP
jgi:hypothetical protein